MGVNRGRAPRIHAIEGLQLPDCERIVLDNGIPVTLLPGLDTEMLRLDICFEAGRQHEHKRLAARATASLLKEGGSQYNGASFAAAMDRLGSTWESPAQLDHTMFSWTGLSRLAGEALIYIADVLGNPIFPESEIRAFVQRNRSRLRVELTQPDVVGYRELSSRLLGENHPFGWNTGPEILEDLRREDLLRHHRDWFTASQCHFFLAGKIPPGFMTQVNQTLGQLFLGRVSPPAPQIPPPKPIPGLIEYHLPQTLQSSLHLGFTTCTRLEKEYPAMLLLHTILGGFFGSRLMGSVRERKGYTYHIQSMLDTLPGVGMLWISAELSPRHLKATRRQIFREMARLREKPVSGNYLRMVRNYLFGAELHALDGPFSAMELFREWTMEGLEALDYAREMEKIRTISPEEIRVMAENSFDPETFTEVWVRP